MSSRRLSWYTEAALAIGVLTGCTDRPGRAVNVSPPPDAIIVNGIVITMDSARPTAEAVAVREGKIAAVGGGTEIRQMAGPSTEVIDLGGRVLLPGFVDAHSHFPYSGNVALYSVNLASPPLGSISNIDDLVAALRLKAGETSKGRWVEGRGYDQTLLKEGRHPTRTDLDRASTDHPIFITHASGHVFVANSMALALAKVNKDTPQPKDGVIVKDPKTGEPTGVLEEVDAGIRTLLPPPTREEQREGFNVAVREYVKAGVTTATVTGMYMVSLDEYEEARKTGLLTLRVFAMPFVNSASPIEPAHARGDDILMTGLAVKIIHDGSIQAYTGYLKEPYHVPFKKEDKSYRGYPRQTRVELIELVKKLNRAGYQIAIHANGDAAIDDVIEAYRQALKDHPRSDARFRIEHSQMAREDQLDAMKELGITPSFFVSHTYYWGDQHRDIFQGPKRAARTSPLRSAASRGLRFSIHLDAPVTPMSPLQAVWSAVNRITRSGQVLGADQRITPAEALRAVTIDAAWQIHHEALKGSIEPGKFADFVVLAENPLAVDRQTIKDIQVLRTIVGGKTVYQTGQGDRK